MRRLSPRRPSWLRKPGWLRPAEHVTGPPNPFEAFLLFACLVQGSNVLLGGPRPNSITGALPNWMQLLWGAMVAIGGGLAITGLYWRGNKYTGAEIKRIGFAAAGGAALVYGLALLTIGPSGTTAAISNLAFVCACAVRWWQVGRAIVRERQIETTRLNIAEALNSSLEEK